jgi:predicted nucleotidyltransferase
MTGDATAGGAVPDRLAPYVEAWRRRRVEEEEADRRRREEAWDEARKAARLLVDEFGVRRVVAFGSLASGRFRRGSDVDLAVEGLPPERFFRADARLAWELSVPIDLKLLADCPPLLRKRIEEEGVELA